MSPSFAVAAAEPRVYPPTDDIPYSIEASPHSHFCEFKDLDDLNRLLHRLWDIAAELVPTWDPAALAEPEVQP